MNLPDQGRPTHVKACAMNAYDSTLPATPFTDNTLYGKEPMKVQPLPRPKRKEAWRRGRPLK